MWSEANEKQIIAHHNRLIGAIKPLSPIPIYLHQADVQETIVRVAKERVFPEGKWIDYVNTYIEKSFYGQRNNFKGINGTTTFYAHRQKVEMKIIEQLSIPYTIIENIEFDLNHVWTGIDTYLDKIECRG